jgi:hypothetical protein
MTQSKQAAEAILRLGGFPLDGPLTGYVQEAIAGQTVFDRAKALTEALDYLGVLGPKTHPAPRAR